LRAGVGLWLLGRRLFYEIDFSTELLRNLPASLHWGKATYQMRKKIKAEFHAAVKSVADKVISATPPASRERSA